MLEGVEFGWKAIIDLFMREMNRRRMNDRELVPRLKESYIIRDSWTKLSVEPSKIMQVHICLRYCNKH